MVTDIYNKETMLGVDFNFFSDSILEVDHGSPTIKMWSLAKSTEIKGNFD